MAAAREQSQSAQEEAEEWKRKRKYDIAVREAKAALETAAIVQHYTNKQTQLREDALREEFSGTLAEKVSSLMFLLCAFANLSGCLELCCIKFNVTQR